MYSKNIFKACKEEWKKEYDSLDRVSSGSGAFTV